MTDDLFLIDSNILIYNYDTTDKAKHEIAKNLIDECWHKGENLVISSQNLAEFFSVTTQKKILTKQEALDNIEDIADFSGFIKISYTHETVLEAAKISEQHNMHFWDSLLAATMKQHGILNLYTENASDFKVPWLNVVNPFETANRMKIKGKIT